MAEVKVEKKTTAHIELTEDEMIGLATLLSRGVSAMTRLDLGLDELCNKLNCHSDSNYAFVYVSEKKGNLRRTK